MHAHKVKVTIPADHRVAIALPEGFPVGPAEVIVLAETQMRQRVVRLASVLAPAQKPPSHLDPIADALEELRRDRNVRFEPTETDSG